MGLRTMTRLGLCALLLCGIPAAAHGADIADSDFDGSGVVDFQDFLLFAAGFGKQAGQAGYDARLDLDGSNAVDFPDFLAFVQYYGRSTTETLRTYVYISDLERDGGKIEVLDTETNLIDPSRTIYLDKPRGMAFSSINRQIYVAGVDTFYALSEAGVRAYAIPLVYPSPVFEGAYETRGGFKIALSPDGRFAYVTEETAGQVEVINLAQQRSETQIDVGGRPVGIAISPDGGEVYVARGGSTIAIVDGVRHMLKDTLNVGDADVRRTAISSDGRRLYMNDNYSGRITVLDLQTRTVAATVDLADASDVVTQILDVALSADGATLYATVNRTAMGFDLQLNPVPIFYGSLVVVDTAGLKAVGEAVVAEVAANLGVSPDGKTAYITGVESILAETPIIQVFIVDLTDATAPQKAGSLRGFSLPVEVKFRSGKPVLPPALFAEIVVF